MDQFGRADDHLYRSPTSRPLRLLLSGFVLNNIPVLHENAVLNAKNVSRDPIHYCPKPGKTTICDNEVSFGNGQTSFVTQSVWEGLYQVEWTLTARFDVRTVLNVVRGPVALGRYVVPFVEESVKSLKNECLVLFLV